MLRFKKFAVLCFLVMGSFSFLWNLLGSASAWAEDNAAYWQGFKELYDADKSEQALAFLEAHPGKTVDYFYNLGTVLGRLDRPGPAVAYLEKAFSLKPSDHEIELNLEIERDALGRLIGASRLDPASNWGERLADLLKR